MSIDVNAPKKGKPYLHYKGGHYRVICVARLSELREVEVVVYASMEHGGRRMDLRRLLRKSGF